MTQSSAIILVAGFALLLVILFGDELKKRKRVLLRDGLSLGQGQRRERAKSGQGSA